MRGGAVAVVAAITLAVLGASADAAGPADIEALGKGYWCEYQRIDGARQTCGGLLVIGRKRLESVATFRFGERPVRNFNFRVCSKSPSGNRRCIARRTRHRDFGDGAYVVDVFRFQTVFPHRLEGVYKLTWWQHGKRFGGKTRLRVVPW